MILRERIAILKKALTVPEYFRTAGFVPKGMGTPSILCPFHKEKTPSCYLFPEKYHCFGCNENGDIIDAHMKLNKVNFLKALDDLSYVAGINQSPEFRRPGGNSRKTNSRADSGDKYADY